MGIASEKETFRALLNMNVQFGWIYGCGMSDFYYFTLDI